MRARLMQCPDGVVEPRTQSLGQVIAFLRLLFCQFAVTTQSVSFQCCRANDCA